MGRTLLIDVSPIKINDVIEFALNRNRFEGVRLTSACEARVLESRATLQEIIAQNTPLYGVTTGYGDSCARIIAPEKSAELQHNLISFLNCGVGPVLPREASRAITLIRLNSITRGYSGVTIGLIEALRMLLEKDILPVIPRQGSLGASGDLIPLSYLAQCLQAQGDVWTPEGILPAPHAFKKAGLHPYRFQAKEGLAIVNGTSAMAGLALLNFARTRFLVDMATGGSAWMVLAIGGRTEAFGELVNGRAKTNPGQREIALRIRQVLALEKYKVKPLREMTVADRRLSSPVQDRYSIRCSPQILAPIRETMTLVENWLEHEINSATDNPLVDENGQYATGGNFYGGYLVHAMDYLKICVGHLADLIDRQSMLIIDEKTNNGLPANLSGAWISNEREKNLHHGLKGLNIALSAITADILSRSMPAGLFSRSSEVHNQDKVSMGMNAAVQCHEIVETAFSAMAMHFVALAQALDLRKRSLIGPKSIQVYGWVRESVPFLDGDRAIGSELAALSLELKHQADLGTRLFSQNFEVAPSELIATSG